MGGTDKSTVQPFQELASKGSNASNGAVKNSAPSVSKTTLRELLSQRSSERTGCLSVPFTAAFFTFYMLSISYHEDVRTHFLFQSSMKRFIEDYTFDDSQSRNLYWIKEHKDVWGWLYQAALPAFFQQVDHLNRPLARDDWSSFLGRNKLIGGVLVEQYRHAGSPPPSCNGRFASEAQRLPNATEGPHNLYFPGEGFIALPAAPTSDKRRRLRAGGGGKGSSTESTSTIREGAWHLPYMVDAEPQDTYPFILFEQEPVGILKERIADIEKLCWIDGGTEQISVRLNIINKDLDFFQYVTIVFVFPVTGGIFHGVKTHSSSLNGYHDFTGMVYDAVFLALLMHIFASEVKEVYHSWKQKELSEYFQDFWNCLDWATIVCGWIISATFAYYRLGVEELKELFEKIDISKRPDAQYWGDMYNVHNQAETVGVWNMIFRTMTSMFTLLIMLRFFKAFASQPRLAVVTNTMYAASSDIIHFGIVLAAVFVCFAFSGNRLFGERLHEFSTFAISFGTCFALICGDVNWAELAEKHQITAATWFFSFMVLLYLIMMNMLLAIVMDVYFEVRSGSVDGDPVWEQAASLVRCMISKVCGRTSAKPTIQYDDLLKDLEKLEENVTQQSLKKAIPQISYMQSEQIIDEALRWEEHSLQQSHGLSSALKELHQMSLQIGVLKKRLKAKEKKKISIWTRKARRIIMTALWSGELKRVADTMADENVQQKIKEEEKLVKERVVKKKMMRADNLLVDDTTDKNKKTMTKNTPSDVVTQHDLVVELENQKLQQFLVQKSHAEVQELRLELKRTQREQATSFMPLLRAVAQSLQLLQVIPPSQEMLVPVAQSSPRSRNARNMKMPQARTQAHVDSEMMFQDLKKMMMSDPNKMMMFPSNFPMQGHPSNFPIQGHQCMAPRLVSRQVISMPLW